MGSRSRRARKLAIISLPAALLHNHAHGIVPICWKSILNYVHTLRKHFINKIEAARAADYRNRCSQHYRSESEMHAGEQNLRLWEQSQKQQFIDGMKQAEELAPFLQDVLSHFAASYTAGVTFRKGWKEVLHTARLWRQCRLHPNESVWGPGPYDGTQWEGLCVTTMSAKRTLAAGWIPMDGGKLPFCPLLTVQRRVLTPQQDVQLLYEMQMATPEAAFYAEQAWFVDLMRTKGVENGPHNRLYPMTEDDLRQCVGAAADGEAGQSTMAQTCEVEPMLYCPVAAAAAGETDQSKMGQTDEMRSVLSFPAAEIAKTDADQAKMAQSDGSTSVSFVPIESTADGAVDQSKTDTSYVLPSKHALPPLQQPSISVEDTASTAPPSSAPLSPIPEEDKPDTADSLATTTASSGDSAPSSPVPLSPIPEEDGTAYGNDEASEHSDSANSTTSNIAKSPSIISSSTTSPSTTSSSTTSDIATSLEDTPPSPTTPEIGMTATTIWLQNTRPHAPPMQAYSHRRSPTFSISSLSAHPVPPSDLQGRSNHNNRLQDGTRCRQCGVELPAGFEHALACARPGSPMYKLRMALDAWRELDEASRRIEGSEEAAVVGEDEARGSPTGEDHP